jgi:hypothetical protein
MKQTSSDATDRWPELWRGDSQVTLEAAMSLIGHLEAFYRDLDSENKQLWAAVNFPEPRKRNAKRAPLACFARLLSHRFQRNFGKPCDEVIADLANVVFDTPDGRRMLGQRTVIAATIYALRRFATVG